MYTVPQGSGSWVVHANPNGEGARGRFGLLDPQGATAVIQQVNIARSSMRGINRIPLPAGRVIALSNGNLNVQPQPGHLILVRADGTVSLVQSMQARSRSSDTSTGLKGISFDFDARKRILFDRKGKIQEIHTASVDVYHGPHGIRTIVTKRPDGKILVGTGAHSGYLEDHFNAGGISYVRRSYLAGRSESVRIYRAYDYRGHRHYRYISRWNYPADFYVWTKSPWYPPVLYPWNPPKWLDRYGHYYDAPFVNLSVSDWIAEYFFIAIFNDAYSTDGEDANASPAPNASQDPGDSNAVYADADAPVTPELQQAIASQVQEQLNEEAEDTEASDAAQEEDTAIQEWTPNRYFVAGNPVEVATEDGRTCLLDAGNVLRLANPPSWPATDSRFSTTTVVLPNAQLTIVASRRSDCPADSVVNVPVDQLEEMENGFRAHLGDGLQALYTQQKQNGLPAIPASVTTTPEPLYATSADDSKLQPLLTEQEETAAQTEADARNVAVTELTSAGQP